VICLDCTIRGTQQHLIDYDFAVGSGIVGGHVTGAAGTSVAMYEGGRGMQLDPGAAPQFQPVCAGLADGSLVFDTTTPGVPLDLGNLGQEVCH
jgi:hypothetical protein